MVPRHSRAFLLWIGCFFWRIFFRILFRYQLLPWSAASPLFFHFLLGGCTRIVTSLIRYTFLHPYCTKNTGPTAFFPHYPFSSTHRPFSITPLCMALVLHFFTPARRLVVTSNRTPLPSPTPIFNRDRTTSSPLHLFTPSK